MYKITEREMTLDDFLKLKKIKPFKGTRADAKGINFGALFGCSGPSLGVQLKGYGFDENKVNTAMTNFQLENAVNQQIISAQTKAIEKGGKASDVDPLSIKYSIVGTKIRELFFKIYPCLLKRTEREQKFGKKHGYVRSWTGPVRHLPELRFMKKNADGEVVGADAVLYKSAFAHLCNDATNSPIQTAEVYQAMPDVTAQIEFVTRFGLKSRVFNYVHDSFECYIYKPERDLYYAFLTALAAYDRQPYFDIPMHIDIEESDLSEGGVFREGKEINIEKFDLKEEIEKWNEKFPMKQLNYDDVYQVIIDSVPLHGVIDGKRYVGKKWTPKKCANNETFIKEK